MDVTVVSPVHAGGTAWDGASATDGVRLDSIHEIELASLLHGSQLQTEVQEAEVRAGIYESRCSFVRTEARLAVEWSTRVCVWEARTDRLAATQLRRRLGGTNRHHVLRT